MSSSRNGSDPKSSIGVPGSSDSHPSVTVVICSFTERRWDDLTKAIESVAIQSIPPDQSVLVIDHNESLYARASKEFPDLHIVRNNHRRGLSGARNTGIESARSEVVAFLDDDAVAQPRWLETLIEPYADPRVHGTGGVVRASWVEAEPSWFPVELHWVVGCSYRGLPEAVAPIRNPIGASMSFRRRALSDLGGFDSDLGRVADIPLGCEETLVGIRVARQYGPQSILQVPSAIVDHSIGPERASIRYLLKRCFAEGVSKAVVAQLVGAADASSAERRYVTRVLPRGIGAGLAQLARGDSAGGARAGTIVLGLFTTMFGYGLGRLRVHRLVTQIMTRRSRTADGEPDGPAQSVSIGSEANQMVAGLSDEGRRLAKSRIDDATSDGYGSPATL
jgi:glycosyltransferase involved in cell wall biosynthesis